MRIVAGIPHSGRGRQMTVRLSTTTFIWLFRWLLLLKL